MNRDDDPLMVNGGQHTGSRCALPAPGGDGDHRGETAALRAARAALASGAWEERYAATARLARLGARQPSVVVALLGRMRDEHAAVRAAAAAALATLHDVAGRCMTLHDAVQHCSRPHNIARTYIN